MDTAGLINDITDSAMLIYRGRHGLDTEGKAEEGRINYRKGLVKAIEVFKKVQSSARENLSLLMLSEYTFLCQELQFCPAADTKARASLTKAIEEFDEAFLVLEVLQNTECYKYADKIFSHRAEFRYKEMPKDAFHVACAGHNARISNILKTPGLNLIEKELLSQRRANMITAQAVYFEKQKLLISPP